MGISILNTGEKLPLRKRILKAFSYLRVGEGGQYLVRDPRYTASGAAEENQTNQRGNKYTEYGERVIELTSKYLGKSTYGCGTAQCVINFLTGQTCGTGAILSSKNKETQKFLDDYIRWNRLDSNGLFDMARIGHIEGKIARIPVAFPDADEELGFRISNYTLRYAKNKYKIELDATNKPVRITFPDSSAKTIEGGFAVYQFHGFRDDPNDTPSPASLCLGNFEAIDHLISDIRLYNKTWPGVTQVFEMRDTESAAWLFNKLFRQIGTDQYGRALYGRDFAMSDSLIIPGGTAKVLEPAGNAVNSLIEELMANFRIISGNVGQPVIYLGPVDLPSNRATAQEQPEMINAVTHGPREELEHGIVSGEIRIAAELYTQRTNRALDLSDVTCRIPFNNMSWLQLWASLISQLDISEIISKQTQREMFPIIDPVEEGRRIKEEKKANMENFSFQTRINDDQRQDKNNGIGGIQE